MGRSSKPFSYGVRALLASAVLYFAADLSRADRGTIDYVVLGLIVCAIAWNVGQLARRMYRAGGGKALWWVQRTVLFWLLGLLNTLWRPPEHPVGWRGIVGWILIAFAAIDTIRLLRAEWRVLANLRSPAESQESQAL